MRQTDAEAAQDLLANAGVKLKCLSFAIYDKYHLCLSGVLLRFELHAHTNGFGIMHVLCATLTQEIRFDSERKFEKSIKCYI